MSFILSPIVSTLSQKWNYVFKDLSDERTRGWPMTDSPVPLILLIIAYYQFVKIIGPAFMDFRKPYNINKLVQVYNVIQVVSCAWLFLQSFSSTFGPFGAYSWTCQPMDKSMSPLAVKVATYTWMYYMLKIFDLLDTVFFVLRKKNNQITFLHVYHHIGVLLVGYIGSKYYPDGQGFIIIPFNCFVHCFMYTYYFLSNYYTDTKKIIWWKKHMTQMQIVQFFLFTYHIGKVLFTGCDYPAFPVYLFVPQNLLILILFCKFYYKAYLESKEPSKKM